MGSRKRMARKLAAALLPWMWACLLFAACKTEYVTVPEYHVRDSLIVRYVRDSVATRDSVFVSQYVSGDTVYRVREATKMVYRDRLRTDTVAVARRDSVPYAVEKKVTEYKWRVRWYDKFCRLFTAAAVLAALAWFLAWYVKKRR